MTTTWNPSDVSTAVVLSNGNLTAGSSGVSGGGGVRATKSPTSGGTYWEVTYNTSGSGNVGIANAAANVEAPGGGSAYWVQNYATYIVAVDQSSNFVGLQPSASLVAGDIVGVAFDADNSLLYFSRNGAWLFGADPASGVGGIPTAAPPYFPYAQVVSSGSPLTLNPSATAYSPPSGFMTLDGAPVVTQPPSNSTLPTITGAPQVGSALFASTGTWTQSPTSYAYQWKADGVAISGEITSAYAPTSDVVGMAITVTVTATNAIGSTSATSAATDPVSYGPVTALVTTTGAGSYTFTSTDLPNGTGVLSTVEAWGAGASGGRRGHGSGGGAYGSSGNGGSGWAISVGDTVYWNVTPGPAGTTATTGGTPSGATWIRLGANAAPTASSQGVSADSGAAGTSTTNGAGGTTGNTVAEIEYAGGTGSSTGSGTTLRGGGGGGAGSTGAGHNASAATAGTANGNGGAGGAGTTTATAGAGTAPGGGGGSTSSASGTGGAGGRGQIQFTFTPNAAGGGTVVTVGTYLFMLLS